MSHSTPVIKCVIDRIWVQEFLRPIITPYELELALRENMSWSSKYLIDFDEVLADQATKPDGMPPPFWLTAAQRTYTTYRRGFE